MSSFFVNPMDCSMPGFSVHGILQVRILEWVAISSSRRSSPSRDPTCVSCFGRQIIYLWATRKAPRNLQTLFFFLVSNVFAFYFFFPCILISWRLITLQYCNVFLPYIDMNQPWLYICSPSRSPLLPPSPSHPSGSSQCKNMERFTNLHVILAQGPC